MGCPLDIPSGTVFSHNGIRIAFVEPVDDVVLRFVIEGTHDEYFREVDGIRVRFTVASLAQEFSEGRLRDFGTSEKTLSEWQGRYLGLDFSAIIAREPRVAIKYDIALSALKQRLPRNAALLQEFAQGFVSDSDNDAPSGRSVIRWMNNLQDHDQRIGALKNRSGRKKGFSPLPLIVDRQVHQSAALFYADEALKKMDCHALVTRAWEHLKTQGVEGIGKRAPSKTTVVNRINACESKETFGLKFGRHEADRHFLASGVSTSVTRPFQLAEMDGTEYEQICHFSEEVKIPAAKLKSIWIIDTASKFVYQSTPFAGPYRPEKGMEALLGALLPPVLNTETIKANPMLAFIFGRLGRLRVDNDRALLPPTAIANLANVITRVELARRYGPDEKPNIENFNGFLMRRLDGLPGTVLSARSRRKSIRRDPLAEASITIAEFCRIVEELRLEWNDTGHAALGGRTPNEVMLEELAISKIRFSPPDEIRRQLARTASGVLTTDGVEFDKIRYRWNRTGVTKLLSENISGQKFASRLEGTARCDVWMRVYDWNLDFIEILDENNNEYVTLWSDDPDYTGFLSRYEHKFHKECVNSGRTGAQTADQKALRRGESLARARSDLISGQYSIAKKAAAVLECAEMRAKAGNLQNDPDLSNFEHLLIATHIGARDRVDIPKGPSQSRGPKSASKRKLPMALDFDDPEWGAFDPPPKSNLQMLEIDDEEDLDGGIDWDDIDADDSTQGSK